MAHDKSQILLIGAGGHAASCIDAIESQGCYEIVGLIVKEDEVGREFFGYPVLGCDSDLERLATRFPLAFVAFGAIDKPETRLSMIERLMYAGFKMPTIVASTAYVSPRAKIGQGTIVMHGVVINAEVRIGGNCIINSNALIEHDSSVGEYCHISTGVIINGKTTIGDNCFIGSGCVVRNGISVGPDCFVGMAQNLVQDLPAQSRITKS
jgi:sugar O-acyltransferase (sialic acid O-acetyltransferase NeuD family)